jgi:hypothetical protein
MIISKNTGVKMTKHEYDYLKGDKITWPEWDAEYAAFRPLAEMTPCQPMEIGSVNEARKLALLASADAAIDKDFRAILIAKSELVARGDDYVPMSEPDVSGFYRSDHRSGSLDSFTTSEKPKSLLPWVFIVLGLGIAIVLTPLF